MPRAADDDQQIKAVLVYGHRTFSLNVLQFARELARRVEALPRRPSHDALIDLLVDLGEAESGVADALSPREDELHDAFGVWQCTSMALADAVCASARADDVEPHVARLRAAAAALDRPGWPTVVEVRTAEGFAHYALFPEQYILATETLVTETQPASLLFVGLRSIGSILAHVAAAAARRAGVAAAVVSVRPRGDPFDRQLALGTGLRRFVERSDASIVAVVDEGPGLSGSSLAAAADALVAAGLEPSRIVLLPAWEAAPDTFVSERGRRAWTRHRHFVAPFAPSWTSDCVDLSAGRWRASVMRGSRTWPAVQPQHERRKYLRGSADRQELFRFAGLGRYGRAKYVRAAAFASAGFGPSPTVLRDGFLGLAWMHGRPVSLSKAITPAFLERLAQYAAFVRRFETGEQDDVEELAEAATCNARVVLGPPAAAALSTLAREAAAFVEPRVAVDGRLLPHDWIDTGANWLKSDALDHHADDFLPGCRDIAWDLAGEIVEFALSPAAEATLAARYAALARDRTIADRLPFYCGAYLSYRAAYATLCAQTLGESADGSRFRRLARRYRHSLDERLRQRRQGRGC